MHESRLHSLRLAALYIQTYIFFSTLGRRRERRGFGGGGEEWAFFKHANFAMEWVRQEEFRTRRLERNLELARNIWGERTKDSSYYDDICADNAGWTSAGWPVADSKWMRWDEIGYRLGRIFAAGLFVHGIKPCEYLWGTRDFDWLKLITKVLFVCRPLIWLISVWSVEFFCFPMLTKRDVSLHLLLSLVTDPSTHLFQVPPSWPGIHSRFTPYFDINLRCTYASNCTWWSTTRNSELEL